MIQFKLNTPSGEILVGLDSEQPHKVAPISYSGDPHGILAVKRWLVYERGALGQEMGEWAAPIDLKAAMGRASAKPFAPALVEERMGPRQHTANEPSEG